MKTLIFLLLISTQLSAQEISKQSTLTCSYAGGIARETQNIRQIEHDDWATFEQKTRAMFKNDQGLSNLLTIAKTVYDFAHLDADVSDVFNAVFDSCMGRHITQTVSAPEFAL
jgi:hypothetical protein